MYSVSNYISRGALFLRNNTFKGHKKLATLMIYATDKCNSVCKHCLVWAKKPKQNLPFEKIREIVQSRVVTKNTVIGLEGGEFLLHPEADDIMSYLDKSHPKYDLLSNCVQPERTIKAIENHNPLRLFISLDGNPETHAYMRGNNGYNSVLEVIKSVKNKVPVSVMFTLTPYNGFNDLNHVAEICKEFNIDMRVGIYNNMPFFDTVDEAHKINTKSDIESVDFINRIPNSVKNFSENYDFMVLYDFWRKGNLFLKCNSILDSIIILPDGSVPVCQNLDIKLGNINDKPLHIILNSKEAVKIQKKLKADCNKCWINFHRKYDIILYRSAEKAGGRFLGKLLFGSYNWTESGKTTYKGIFKNASN